MAKLVGIVLVLLVFLVVFFFVRYIFKSLRSERNLRKIFSESSSGINVSGEPFPGAVYLAGLLVFISGSQEYAQQELKKSFSREYPADWTVFCRIAWERRSELNPDFLVECLGNSMKKKHLEESLSRRIMFLLQQAENTHREMDGVNRPSGYLSELLGFSLMGKDVLDAFALLELDGSASFGEVKASYRRLARLYHPDSNPGNEEKFQQVQKAYETITGFKSQRQ